MQGRVMLCPSCKMPILYCVTALLCVNNNHFPTLCDKLKQFCQRKRSQRPTTEGEDRDKERVSNIHSAQHHSLACGHSNIILIQGLQV